MSYYNKLCNLSCKKVVYSGFIEEPTNCLRFLVFLINSVVTFHIYVLR